MGRVFSLSIGLSLLAACGSVKDSGSGIDAPPGGEMAGPDADNSGNVTVTAKAALFSQAPNTNIADVDLISSLPNGMQLSTAKTDGGGAASIRVVPGGQLTAAYKHPNDMGYDFYTFVGVKPTDAVEFGNSTPIFVGSSTNLGSMTYTWPLVTGATQYIVVTGCAFNGAGAGVSSLVASESSSCHRGNPMDVFMVAVDTAPNPDNILNCRNLPNQTFTSGGTITNNGWSNPIAVTANITGLPAEFTGVNTSVQTTFRPVLHNQFEQSFPSGGFANGTATGGAFTGNFQYCSVGDRTAATLTLNRNGFFQTRVIDSLPSNATSWTVAAPQLPPALEGGGILSSALGRRAGWSIIPGTNNTHDAVFIQFSWTHEIGGTNHRSNWFFVLPPNTDEVEFPKLPASFDQVMPQAQFGLGLNQIRVIEIPTVMSYDAYRAQGMSTAICPDCAVRAGDLQRVIISGS
jgi:hypothetical protein